MTDSKQMNETAPKSDGSAAPALSWTGAQRNLPRILTAGGERRSAEVRWGILAVLLAAQFMTLLDATITNVALPAISRSLHTSGAELQLVVAGYIVSYATLLITGARLGDLVGRRRMFMAGTALFTLSSLACGLAPGIGTLIAARFVQGAGAAAMVPQVLSVIQLRFTGAARTKALSAYGVVLSSGFAAGQVIGGILVTADLFGSSWRPVFLVNVPIGLAVLALAPKVVPPDERTGTRRLDLPGLAVSAAAICLIVLPLLLGHQEGWPGWLLACIGAGCVLSVAFVFTERAVAARGGDSLLRLSVLRSPGLPSGLVSLFLVLAGYGGFLFIFAIHLQTGLGYSALRAGLTFVPLAAAFGVCSCFWRALPARWHYIVPPAGCLIAAAGYAALGLEARGGGTIGLSLQACLVVTGASLALSFSPLVTQALIRVPLDQAADASGLLTSVFQLSQAVGVAVFGSVFLAIPARVTAHERIAEISGHSLETTVLVIALTTAAGALACIPLARTVRSASRSS
jgi:MFS family permease